MQKILKELQQSFRFKEEDIDIKIDDEQLTIRNMTILGVPNAFKTERKIVFNSVSFNCNLMMI